MKHNRLFSQVNSVSSVPHVHVFSNDKKNKTKTQRREKQFPVGKLTREANITANPASLPVLFRETVSH